MNVLTSLVFGTLFAVKSRGQGGDQAFRLEGSSTIDCKVPSQESESSFILRSHPCRAWPRVLITKCVWGSPTWVHPKLGLTWGGWPVSWVGPTGARKGCTPLGWSTVKEPKGYRATSQKRSPTQICGALPRCYLRSRVATMEPDRGSSSTSETCGGMREAEGVTVNSIFVYVSGKGINAW